MLSPLAKETVFGDIIDKTALAEKFSLQQIAKWKALRSFHETYTTSADLPPSGMTCMPLTPDSELDLLGLERPLCKVSTPPPWSELWRRLAYQFPRPHLEAAPSAGAAAARPAPVAQPLPPAQRPLPSHDEIALGNRGIVGINQNRLELAQSRRNLDVSQRIQKMPPFEPVVEKGKLYFVQVDKGFSAQLAPQRPRGCPRCFCARPGGLTTGRTSPHTHRSLRLHFMSTSQVREIFASGSLRLRRTERATTWTHQRGVVDDRQAIHDIGQLVGHADLY